MLLARPLRAHKTAPTGRRPERGAVAVEFALVLPVLAMLLMGIVTGGVTYSRTIGLTNAVREGARFGATTSASSPTWLSDTTSRVRGTQFDDGATASTSSTSVCVQLVKVGSPNTEVSSSCSVGSSNAPSLTMPAMTDFPAVPSGSTSGTCLVRVVAARKFTINIALTSFSGTVTRGSVAQYERGTC
jgi:Flp pilus assembly protein TadG